MNRNHHHFALACWLVLLMLPTVASAFSFNDVIGDAKALAGKSYVPPVGIPQFLHDLNSEQYQGIRFKPENSLWAPSHSLVQVSLVSPGMYYDHPVKLHVIDAQGVHDVLYDKNSFTFTNQELGRRIPADLGYAGFQLTYPDKSAAGRQAMLEFAGASYFRAIGRNQVFGVSARGVAVDTGLPSGEQFPAFREFWLVRPDARDPVAVIYALLDGKNLTGAYRFEVHVGDNTVIDVQAHLFIRNDIAMLGIAPLTSMFFYGNNTGRPLGQWRPQVHDSDGLLTHNGASGEWLWRPLLNPKTLKLDYFQTDSIQGFGLLQRQTLFSDYADPAARFQDRPSAWVQPKGDWGKGNVVLVQLPTNTETNDNVTSFWTPGHSVKKGDTLQFAYKLTFGNRDIPGSPLGRARDTYVGDGNKTGGGSKAGAYRVIVDFAGGALDALPPDTPVTSTVSVGGKGKIYEHFVEYLPSVKQWRLSILAKPEDGKPLSLRAFLKNGDDTISETWSYEIPVVNTILGEAH